MKRVEIKPEMRSNICKCGEKIATHGLGGRMKTKCWDCEAEDRRAAKRARRAVKKGANA